MPTYINTPAQLHHVEIVFVFICYFDFFLISQIRCQYGLHPVHDASTVYRPVGKETHGLPYLSGATDTK
jgi:hypothetical protein